MESLKMLPVYEEMMKKMKRALVLFDILAGKS